MMKIAAFKPGPPEDMFLKDVAMPEPGEMEVRIRVVATAVNRVDTMIRQGLYPSPEGIGLEASGVIDKVGKGCPSKVAVGQRVMALLSGGGNAEYVVCRHEFVLPVPENLTLTEAAAIPEVWITAFQLLYHFGKLSSTDTVLIHAGGSGVGTAAIQLVKQAGATSIVTAGSKEKIDFAKSLGAKEGINYKEPNWSKKVLDATNGQGVSLIMDCVGASMFDENANAIKLDGRWVIYGALGGHMLNTSLAGCMTKRVNLTFGNLLFQSVEEKEAMIKKFSDLALSQFKNGSFKPVIHTVIPLADIAKGHRMCEENKNLGKILLKVSDE